MSPDVVALVESLHADGLSATATRAELSTLDQLLPPEVPALVAAGSQLALVPAGALWSVPWAAVADGDGALLGERNPLTFAPSLTLLGHRAAQADARPVRIRWWRSRQVMGHEVAAYVGRSDLDVSELAAEDIASALVSGGEDLVVVVAHGRPVAGIGAALDLDGVAVTPADLLRGTPPAMLALISCWGAHAPTSTPGDPLTLATLALARGATWVAGASSVLRDDRPSTAFTNLFLSRVTASPAPEALMGATRRWLARPDYRNGYLARWAPLRVLGA